MKLVQVLAILTLLTQANALFAETGRLPTSSIGVVNLINDHASLIVHRDPSKSDFEVGRGLIATVTYHHVPDWNVSNEINKLMIEQFKINKLVNAVDLNSHRERIAIGFNINDTGLDEKYINYLTTLNEINNLDYLLIVFPLKRTSSFSLPGLLSLAKGVVHSSTTDLNKKKVSLEYGFVSGRLEGTNSFVSTSYALISIRKKLTEIFDSIIEIEPYVYKNNPTNFATKTFTYKLFQKHVTDKKILRQAYDIIYNSKYLKDEKMTLVNILKNGFDSEYDDELEYALQDLNKRLTTYIILPEIITEKIKENGAIDYDKHLEKVQSSMVTKMVRHINKTISFIKQQEAEEQSSD